MGSEKWIRDSLKTHPWFAYLKPLPKADQMWEGNKKIQ